MTRIQKCRSKNRNPNGGGCGDPQCPEGRSYTVEEAVRNADLNTYFTVREAMEEEDIPLPPLSSLLPTQPTLPGISPKQRVARINKTHIPSYPDIESLNDGLNNLYKGYGSVNVELVEEKGLKFIEVEDMDVDIDFRGMGIGRHMRACILKFGYQNDYPVVGTPTSQGDKTVPKDHEDYSANRLSHRQRLEKFYIDSGYEYNYGTYQFRDTLTGEDLPKNPEWLNQFNETAKSVLKNAGGYIKWPNDTIPTSWKA